MDVNYVNDGKSFRGFFFKNIVDFISYFRVVHDHNLSLIVKLRITKLNQTAAIKVIRYFLVSYFILKPIP